MLPALVSRYAEQVLGCGLATGRVKIKQHSEMTLKQGAESRSFSATETFETEAVAFCWKARFKIIGPLAISVTDSYEGGRGGIEVRVLGVPIQRKRGEMAEGEASRYLAEIPWVPHAIVANPQLEWRKLDPRRVEVATRVVGKRVAVQLTFDEKNHIIETRAERPRSEASNAITPWIGSYRDYREVSGVLIPTQGEVSWKLSTGLFTYWRGEVASLELTRP